MTQSFKLPCGCTFDSPITENLLGKCDCGAYLWMKSQYCHPITNELKPIVKFDSTSMVYETFSLRVRSNEVIWDD